MPALTNITPPREMMLDPRTGAVSRAWYNFFLSLFRQLKDLLTAPFLTAEDETANFPSSLRLIPVSGELERLIDTTSFTLGLADTAVTAGDYGSASETVRYVVDAKGRLTEAEAFDLNTDNVTEGSTNLFFTEQRARDSISGVDGIAYDAPTGVIDTQGFTGTVGPLDFNKGIAAATSTAVAGFTGTVSPIISITFVDGICTAAS